MQLMRVQDLVSSVNYAEQLNSHTIWVMSQTTLPYLDPSWLLFLSTLLQLLCSTLGLVGSSYEWSAGSLKAAVTIAV